MPRFSENEKEIIRVTLMEKGKELFLQFGLRRTSIDSIISASGIAKGSFYTFFRSKEELFLEIWLEEESKYNQFLTEIMTSAKTPKDMIVQVCKGTFEYLESNPFHRNLYERNETEYLIRKLPPGKYTSLIEQDNSTFIPLLEKLQQDGEIIPIEPEIIMGIHRCLSYLPLLKEEIGPEVFPQVLDTMIMFIAEGLTTQKYE